MNELSRPHNPRATTQAAEGVPRLRWTLAEFERLTELGIFTEDDRIELIGGELVPMSPKGNRHENIKTELLNWFGRRLPENARIAVELGWRPNDETYLEPDLLIYGAGNRAPVVSPANVHLAVEVAASSLDYDRGHKAKIYAALGVRDYWVIDAVSLTTRVYRGPSQGGYLGVTDVAATEMLTPMLVASLSLRLADLGLD
jgi:Uma2 family endonuclease